MVLGLDLPEMARIAGISVFARAYFNKHTYFYPKRRPLSQRAQYHDPEPRLLARRTVIEPANAAEARSVVRVDAVVEDFLTDKGKGKGGESGNYREDASRELDRFVDFLVEHEDSPTSFNELDSGHLREYARHLTRQG